VFSHLRRTSNQSLRSVLVAVELECLCVASLAPHDGIA
jgi:hypothetical protein